jgi:hypothetical protein
MLYLKIHAISLFNPSSCNMALGATQPLTEINSRNISWGLNAAGA